MDDPIAGPEQITPAWLTDVLIDRGVLAQGRVLQVVPDSPVEAFASRTWHLDVLYSPDVSRGAPRRLFLKCSSPDLVPGESEPHRAWKEIEFYRSIAPQMPRTPAVPCYQAVHDPHTGRAHLLLLDVSGTHAACRDPLAAPNPQRAVESLAQLHAFWWDHPRLGDGVGRLPTREEREADWADAARRTGEFVQALGDQLPRSWRATYERAVQALPKLSARHEQGRNLTLVHGDAHLGNFLFPRRPGPGRAYLIDWQFWHPTIGGTDLAFMMSPAWDPAARRSLEVPLLRRYHDVLLHLGVDGFDWEACWHDYRLSVILVSLFIPVWRWSVFKWEADLAAVEASMTAFDDLGCADLL